MKEQFVAKKEFEFRSKEVYRCKKLYFPLEGEKVEYSGFYMTLTQLDFAASTVLCVEKTGIYPFYFATCGGAKIYVNGEEQGNIYEYKRNQESGITLELFLEAGENHVYIQCNDLAERDSQIYFKLRYLGTKELSCALPVEIDTEKLYYVEKLFKGVYTKGLNFNQKDIMLYFESPLQEEITLNVDAWFVEPQLEAIKETKVVTLPYGSIGVNITDLIHRSVGTLKVELKSQVGELWICRALQFEYYEEEIMERVRERTSQSQQEDTLEIRRREALKFIAYYGSNVFQKAIAIWETDGDDALARKIVQTELEKVNARFDCSDFRVPGFFYAIKSSKVPEDIKEQLKVSLLKYRYWFDEPGTDVMWYFSENHALCFHTCELLAGEMFPESIFPNSGLTGLEHAKKAKGLLKTWFDNFLKFGFSEWNSAVYIPIDVIGLITLFDMAEDEEIHNLAKESLDVTFRILAINSYKGIVASSYGRIYFRNLVGRRVSESSALNYVLVGEGWMNQNCFATTLIALSSYELSEELLSLYKGNREGMENIYHQGEEQVLLYSYKTTDYILGSVLGYKSGKKGLQEHVIQLMVKDCDTQIWINHPGETVYFGEGRPSYFAGNGTLPLVTQHKNTATLVYDLLDQEVDYTHAYCPLKQFDSWCLEENTLFLQKDNVSVKLYAENGLFITTSGPLKELEVISPGKHNVWRLSVEMLKNRS